MTTLIIIFSLSCLAGTVLPKLRESPRATRLARIGEILATGVSRHLAAACPADSTSSPAETPLPFTETETRLLLDLLKFSSLTPGEIQGRMSCSRSTALRLVKKLRQEGLIESHGKTSGTQVSLSVTGRRTASALNDRNPSRRIET